MQKSWVEEKLQKQPDMPEEVSTPGWKPFPRASLFRGPLQRGFGSMKRQVKTEGSGWRTEEAGCERCNDDKDKTSQVQAERIRGGDSLEAWTGRKVKTVDRVFRARG